MIRHSARILSLALLLAAGLVLAAAPGAQAKKTELVSKVDSFVLLVDHSGSMAEIHKTAAEDKIVMAKTLLAKINDKIPALKYDSRLMTFAPTAKRYSAIYERPGMASAIDGIPTGYDVFGRMTPMGGGLSDITPSLDALPGKIAVIIFSDGENNLGEDPVIVANQLYNAYKGRVCFHVVSLADSAEGQATLDAIAKLSSCSVTADAQTLLSDEAALDQFVRDVFYDVVVIAEPKAKPAPAPAPKVEDVMPLRIHFDFDSAAIRDDMAPILDEAADILKKHPGGVTLEGHTCNIGSDEYNQGLSERRAASVKKYLSGKGIDAGSMEAVGKGESAPKYDNGTMDGRKLNRRVEIIFH